MIVLVSTLVLSNVAGFVALNTCAIHRSRPANGDFLRAVDEWRMRHHASVENLEAVESVRTVHGQRTVRDNNVLAVVRKIGDANERIGVKRDG